MNLELQKFQGIFPIIYCFFNRNNSIDKKLISEHYRETKSKIASEILDNYDNEVKNFKQVCPKEMIDKLSNPLLLKTEISKAV